MSELDDDRDEEWFKEVYGTEYTGPPRAAGAATKRGPEPALAKAAVNKRAPNPSDSEEDDEPRDPNAVPTDFTSREAKVWEAKAKAVERNWKRRKEEELTCRLCGEVGHFAQGCPTTLGGNRKTGEVVERISLRDKRLKPRLIGTGGAIVQGIEKETGCRLKLEDNLTVGNGAFFVKITGPDRVTVNKAMACVNKIVDQVEDEWKQQAGARKLSQGRDNRERGGAGTYQNANPVANNPIMSSQMQLISSQRQHHPHENNNTTIGGRRGDLTTNPPLDEEKRTIEHIASQLEARRQWKAVSGSSQQSLNGSYKEGRTASGVRSLPPAHPGKLNGGSAYYPDMATSYPSQPEMDLEYDAQTLDELERRFLEETIELTKDQNKEEDKENVRHRERLREIQEQFQLKMTKLRAKQAKNREEFLRMEAQLRYNQAPVAASNYSHYQYGDSGASLPPAPSARPNYNEPSLPSRALSAYVDPLPQYEGSYDASYEKVVYDRNPTESLQSLRTNAYGDSYAEMSYSPGHYNRKQGYDNNNNNNNNNNNKKPGYDKAGYDSSNAYNNKPQVYDTKPYSYGTTSQYPAYG